MALLTGLGVAASVLAADVHGVLHAIMIGDAALASGAAAWAVIEKKYLGGVHLSNVTALFSRSLVFDAARKL